MARKRSGRQIAVSFADRPDRASPDIRGGKGSHLATMHHMGLPVPPGFTITTTAARAVMQEGGRLPNRLMQQVRREIAALERKTGTRFGDSQNPLIVSVRSGAAVSMPGMMETILNLGMTDAYIAGNPCVYVQNSWERFVSMYRHAVGGAETMPPSDVYLQLERAIRAILQSWDSPAAKCYRRLNQIPDTLGTAVTVQQMVFGNTGTCSATGVVFSHDPNTGDQGLFGEFLIDAQGEDLVAGVRTPQPIGDMKQWNSGVFQELERYVQQLSDHHDAPVEVEFTVERGTLYLLQCRAAKTSLRAKVTFAVRRVWAKRWAHDRALKGFSGGELALLEEPAISIAPHARATALELARGLPATGGVAHGIVVCSSERAKVLAASGLRTILVRPTTTVEDYEGMLVAQGVVTADGGVTCHAAVVMRGLGRPSVVGCGDLSALHEGMTVTLCGATGQIYRGALPTSEDVRTKEWNIFRRWTSLHFPAPRIDFDAVNKRLSANQILVDFYLLSAMADASQGDALVLDVRRLLRERTMQAAEQFACYLAIAVASEIRYVYGSEFRSLSTFDGDIKTLEREYGITADTQRGSEDILTFLRGRSRDAQVRFFSLCAGIFRGGVWIRAFGGTLWGHIAQAGADFLSGKLAHCLFVDRVFDLRHNGARLFDKHYMFSARTFEGADGALLAQLAVKKNALNVRDLKVGFEATFGNVWTRLQSKPSPDVLALYERGEGRLLW